MFGRNIPKMERLKGLLPGAHEKNGVYYLGGGLMFPVPSSKEKSAQQVRNFVLEMFTAIYSGGVITPSPSMGFINSTIFVPLDFCSTSNPKKKPPFMMK